MARPTREQLAKLSFSELKDVLADVQSLVKEAEAQAREDAKITLQNQAKELGFELDDLFGNKEPVSGIKGKRKSSPSQKVAHPEDHSLTYGGRGRKPAWLTEYLENGGTMEDLVPVNA